MEEKCLGCDSKWAEAIYWTHFRTFHFSQFLGSDQQRQLALPKKFVDNLKKKLPESVALKGPSGMAWNVRLMTDNDALFFKDGWQGFVKDHSLRENDLLVFRYDGGSQFDVLVFDGQSLCEKEASYFVRKCGNTEHDKGCSTKRKLREGSLDEVHNHTNSDDGVGNNSLEKSVNDDTVHVLSDEGVGNTSGQHAANKKTQGKGCSVKPIHANQSVGCGGPATRVKRVKFTDGSAEHTPTNVADVSKRRPVTEDEKENALHLAQAASTEDSFMIVMQPNHVHKTFFMSLPSKWTRKHLAMENHDVILCVGNNTWHTKYYHNQRYDNGGLAGGWKHFAVDNNLEECDVCLFKLAGQSNNSITLDVSIFRDVKKGRRNLIKGI